MSPLSYYRGKRVWRQRHQAPYLMNDAFTDPRDAPFPSPRIMQPGPGSWLSNDADLRMSIPSVGGQLLWAAGGTDWDRCTLAATTPFARKAGLFLEFQATAFATGYLRIGWNFALPASGGGTGATASIQNNEAQIYFTGAGTIDVTDGLDVVATAYPYELDRLYTFRIYATATGWLYYVRETDFPDTWTLLWERVHGFPHVPHFLPTMNNHSLRGNSHYAYVRQGMVKPPILHIPAPDDTWAIYGAAADGIASCDFTFTATQTGVIQFRQLDLFNYWYVHFEFPPAHPAPVMRLVKVIDFAETVVAVTTAAVATGATVRVSVVMFGSHIRTFYGINAGPSADDAYLQTATGCAVSFPDDHFDGTAPQKGQNFQFQTGGRLLLN